VTIGVFDGVHLAHQRLVRKTVVWARRLRAVSVVVTFDPDPHRVLAPGRAPAALMPLGLRCWRLRRLGAEQVRVVRFTRALSRMPPEAFVRRMLAARLRARALVVGHDFAFGRGRRGDLALLRRLAPTLGFRVIPIAPVTLGGLPVSSSRIRRLIARGALARAARLMGGPPVVCGRVVPGTGRGRRLGCPTANLRLIDQVVPPCGVYAVRVGLLAGRLPAQQRPTGRWWDGVMNLGVRPTFGGGPLVCEVHLFGFSGSLRGRPVMVSLLKKLRNERRFPTPKALRRQIAHDVRRAKRLLASWP
jgi:riboflavin kinase/FMN adenylyltransferase